MATPYSTPGYPKAPRPTPSSTAVPSRTALRAPIHNPFDKFTQTEFDAWIGDITGALKQALGYEAPHTVATPSSQSQEVHPGDISAYGDVDDSFAEIKARRAAKGKERAKDEDFSDNEEESGSLEVVVISSDEDEEDEEAEEEVRDASEAEYYDEEEQGDNESIPLPGEEEEEADGEEEEETEEEEDEQTLFPQSANGEDEDEEPFTTQSVTVDLQELDEGTDEYADEDGLEAYADYTDNGLEDPPATRLRHDNFDEYEDEDGGDSVDEEQDETVQHDNDVDGTGEPPSGRSPSLSPTREHTLYEVEDDEDELLEAAEQAAESSKEQPVELPDEWEGPRLYAEDFYAGGDSLTGSNVSNNSHLLPSELESGQVVEVVDEEENEEFPLREDSVQPVDIADPWSAPKMYAEDLYTGGEIQGDISSLSPSHLTPAMSSSRSDNPNTPLTVDDAETGSHTDLNIVVGPSAEDEVVVASDVAPLQDSVLDPALFDAFYSQLSEDMPPAERHVSDISPEDLIVDTIAVLPASPAKPWSPPRLSASGSVEWDWRVAFPAHSSASSEPSAASSLVEDEHLERSTEQAAHDIIEVFDDSAETSHGGPSNENEADKAPAPVLSVDARTAADAHPVHESKISAETDASLPLLSDKVEVPTEVTVHDAQIDALTEQSHTTFGATLEEAAICVAPLSQEDVGFGDLPATPEEDPESNEASANADDVFNSILADIDTNTVGIFADAESSMFVDQTNDAELSDVLVVKTDTSDVEEVPADVPGLSHDEAVEDAAEMHGTFSMPTTTEGDEYLVTEAATDEEPSPSADVDVVTDDGNIPPESLEYVVEEVVTEDILTEKPDIAEVSLEVTVSNDNQPLPQDTSRASRERTPDAQSALRDIASGDTSLSFVAAEPDSEDESPRRRRRRFLLNTSSRSRSGVSSERDGSMTSSPLKSVSELHTLQKVDERAPDDVNVFAQPVESSTVEISEQSIPPTGIPPSEEELDEHQPKSLLHLDSRIPAPVSADPNVPDPASVWASRATSPLADLRGRNRAEELERAAETGNLLKATLKQPAFQTPSGLFTPGTETDSSPASPAIAAESANGSSEGERGTGIANSALRDDESPKTVPDAQGPEADAVSHVTDDGFDAPNGEETRVLDEPDVHDADADGDLDPEYHNEQDDNHPSGSQSSPSSHDDEIDVYTPIPAHSEGDSGVASSSRNVSPSEQPSEYVVPTYSHPMSTFSVSSTPATAEEQGTTDAQDVRSDDITSTTGELSRPLKRKRTSPPPTPPQPRPPIEPEEPRHSDELKESVVEESLEGNVDDDDDLDSIASSRDGELRRPISKGKQPAQRPPSRASSVASSLSDDSREPTPPPPVKLTPPALELPYVHAIGVLHHHHGKAPAQPIVRPAPPPPKIVKERSPAPPDPSESRPSEPSQPQQSESSQIQPPVVSVTALSPTLSFGPSSSSSTPVTRSNCRFHKISIPLDEDAPRVYFVVPGCSLTNSELMEEEEIEDHGDATLADNARLVPNVEALDFSEYLIGVLRQLVGMDLLREHEIFYLPQEGDNIGLKPKSPTKTKPKAHRESVSSRSTAGISRIIKLLRSPSKSKPRRAGSVSTVSSMVRGSLSTAGSASVAGSLSDVESDGDAPPRAKRRKAEKRKAPAASAGPSDSQTFKARRSKRLSSDAAAYKPANGAESEESEEEKPKRKARKSQRGVKRARPSEARQEDNDEARTKPKKRKVQAGDTKQDAAD